MTFSKHLAMLQAGESRADGSIESSKSVAARVDTVEGKLDTKERPSFPRGRFLTRRKRIVASLEIEDVVCANAMLGP